MKTVRKALALLHFFTVSQPSWGLSDLARAAGLDKAGTLRLLKPLVDDQLLEQEPRSRQYRLGSGLLNLARIREVCYPLGSVVQPILHRLAQATGEVAHASVIGRQGMLTIGVATSSQRATQVMVDPSELLPFHATASGIACLAFGEATWSANTLKTLEFDAITPNTPADRKVLNLAIADAKRLGYASTSGTFENEATGIAVPYFDGQSVVQGAIAIVAPSSRVTADQIQNFAQLLNQAAQEVTLAIGGLWPIKTFD